ncbi:sigma-70 family RNA polymerase sigma factor [Vaginisenegalia massiliensis]|uniref:sigma-70 family RNA polymerase sigma factor n=1 Tax=Vaginisenegalia massiliensis TaxID=2058294 RepID=UPI000F542D7C|nr:sigma-70 family RNA polymerase sigma factor [Vaginisenegalia massiliensis]
MIKMEVAQTNEEIVARLQEEFNEADFLQLYNRFVPLFKRAAGMYVIYGYSKEDYLQEGRIALLVALDHFNQERTRFFASYLKMVFKNRMFNLIRHQIAAKRGGTQQDLSIESIVEDPDLDYLGSSSLLMDHYLANPEEVAIVKSQEESYFKHLSDLELAVFKLYLQADDFMTIAQKLNQPYDRVCNAYDRCRQKLRRLV